MSRPRNQMGFLRALLYGLKQSYGAPADVYYESADSVDLETGERAVTKLKWKVRRAINLPTMTAAEGLFPAAVKAVWKRDSAIEAGSKVVIIDRRDLPGGFRLETHNYSVVVDRRRYEVLKVEEFEYQAAYLLTLKELAGARIYEQVEVAVADEVGVDGGP